MADASARFDAITTLSEENRRQARQVGRAVVGSLIEAQVVGLAWLGLGVVVVVVRPVTGRQARLSQADEGETT